jgi:hypothetical protein
MLELAKSPSRRRQSFPLVHSSSQTRHGRIVWHYQETPSEMSDHTAIQQITLAEVKVNSLLGWRFC